jgi:hypothetical protein
MTNPSGTNIGPSPATPAERGAGSAARLAVAALLYVGWIGWLVYLVATTVRPQVHLWPPAVEKTPPVVLSRPQFLVAELVVLAEIDPDDAKSPPVVREVFWPKTEAFGRLVGQPLPVRSLDRRHAAGLEGAGLYLVPLTREGDGWRVTPTPPSPGYLPGPLPRRVYPSTPETLSQLRAIGERLRP